MVMIWEVILDVEEFLLESDGVRFSLDGSSFTIG